MLPRPPKRLIPPTTTTAIAVNSMPSPIFDGIDRDLHGVDDACDRREEARQDEAAKHPPIDRDADAARDFLVVADRRQLAAEGRPAMDEVNCDDDGKGDQRVEEDGPDHDVAERLDRVRHLDQPAIGQ